MKSEIVKGQNMASVKPFPKLMIDLNDGEIVFFHEEDKGTTVFPGANNKVGHYDEDWAMELFTDFDGVIQLSND